ncbi:hypothetical protein AVEN_116176-1 [Araneus ventricosus]|uniref:Uncharacterized protein n=1 Tax=Araneus ventricosus TaxID=182803 RepID=A0A4Y2LHK6_ARAVE|nr:hypothetical protein AVEN_116176-1 [Araneus ventricosus]
MSILRDTGAIDLVSRNHVSSEDFTGETVWVKQSLDLNFNCLPLARTVLQSSDFGRIFIKAAVIEAVLDNGVYLFGNRTAYLIAKQKLTANVNPKFSKININAVGPLPISDKNNSYLLTVICVSSKFLEAIPVADISSVSVTAALLEIFRRMGFPRERKETPGNESDEFGIPYPTSDPNVYDFEETIRDSALYERLSLSEIEELRKLLGLHQKGFQMRQEERI